MYLHNARVLYEQYEFPTPFRYSAEKVELFEKEMGLHFPQAFKEYLLWMGRGNEMFVGSDHSLSQFIFLYEDAKEILTQDNFPKKLPEDALVFWMHGGYQFRFIRLSEGENPPVYYYHYALKNDFEQQAPHFSIWLENMVLGYARVKEEQSKPRSRHLFTDLARNITDEDTQAYLETPEGAPQVAAALQEIQAKLQQQGQGQLMQVIDQSRELAQKGVLKGLEAFLVRYASLSAEQVVEKMLFLQKENEDLLK